MKPHAVLALLGLACCAGAGAQTFKCQDAAGKVTYASRDCAEIGLKSAGEVRGTVNVAPAYKPPPNPAPAPAKAPARDPAPMTTAQPEKKDPERRCFTVKTAKGAVTRCNDKPEEEAAK